MLSAKKINEMAKDSLENLVFNVIMETSNKGEFLVQLNRNLPNWMVSRLKEKG